MLLLQFLSFSNLKVKSGNRGDRLIISRDNLARIRKARRKNAYFKIIS